MNIDVRDIPAAVAIGIGATLLMDLWNLLLKRVLGIPSLNYCLLGRWVRHMAGGRVRHASIAAAEPKSHECTVGWVSHYSIGVVLQPSSASASPVHGHRGRRRPGSKA